MTAKVVERRRVMGSAREVEMVGKGWGKEGLGIEERGERERDVKRLGGMEVGKERRGEVGGKGEGKRMTNFD